MMHRESLSAKTCTVRRIIVHIIISLNFMQRYNIIIDNKTIYAIKIIVKK